MKDGLYESRKEQIEKEFLPDLVRALKAEGFVITRRGYKHIKKALTQAAMVGACAARDHALKAGQVGPLGRAEICKTGVLQLLGYDE